MNRIMLSLVCWRLYCIPILTDLILEAIHGLPEQEYDGVAGVKNPRGYGYCTHNSNFFLPWHRPYVALYEQILVKNAIAQAMLFPAGATRNRYLAAAQSLKMPYWDWTQNTGGSAYPNVFDHPTAKVTLPSGSTTIWNPLYAYRFSPNAGKMVYYPV